MNRFQIVDAMAKRTDSVLVGFSGGKDSIATLIVCLERFKRVECFYLYTVPHLSFRDATLNYARKRWGVVIHEIPGSALARARRRGYLSRSHRAKMPPALSNREVADALRQRTGIEWIAVGEKEHDSMERRGQVRKNPNGVFEHRREFWPLAYWSHSDVWSMLKRHRVPVPAEYNIFGTGFRTTRRDHLIKLARHFPGDFEKVCRSFPLARAFIERERLHRGEKV